MINGGKVRHRKIHGEIKDKEERRRGTRETKLILAQKIRTRVGKTGKGKGGVRSISAVTFKVEILRKGCWGKGQVGSMEKGGKRNLLQNRIKDVEKRSGVRKKGSPQKPHRACGWGGERKRMNLGVEVFGARGREEKTGGRCNKAPTRKVPMETLLSEKEGPSRGKIQLSFKRKCPRGKFRERGGKDRDRQGEGKKDKKPAQTGKRRGSKMKRTIIKERTNLGDTLTFPKKRKEKKKETIKGWK